MTLLVGMYYDDKKGALIATDSREIKGSRYKTVSKIDKIEEMIIACAGSVAAGEELVENIKLNFESEKNIRKRIQNAQQKLYDDHMSGEEPRIEKTEMPEGLFGFYDSYEVYNPTKVFRFHDRILESVTDFEAVGQGGDSTEDFLKRYYSLDISKEQAMGLAIFCIIEAARNNDGVDDNPQISLIDKGGCRILNCDKNGNFCLSNKEISQIKEKMNGIYDYQRKTFEILLGEDKEKKDKLRGLLNNL